jgi:hypothetical protein
MQTLCDCPSVVAAGYVHLFARVFHMSRAPGVDPHGLLYHLCKTWHRADTLGTVMATGQWTVCIWRSLLCVRHLRVLNVRKLCRSATVFVNQC